MIRALEIEMRRRVSDFVYQLRRKVCMIGVEGEVVFVRRLVLEEYFFYSG